MSTTGSSGMGLSAEGRPHAYDPLMNPELFDGVLARRAIAFVIDIIVISIPVILAALFIDTIEFRQVEGPSTRIDLASLVCSIDWSACSAARASASSCNAI